MINTIVLAVVILCAIAAPVHAQVFSVFSSATGPQYGSHFTQAGAVDGPSLVLTVVKQVTKTHTLRVPSTSDVWVTSVRMVPIPVTVYSTSRRFVPDTADTVTSYIRITRTPISIVTRTDAVAPTRTVVSAFTSFVTATTTVEFWQPIVHENTQYEVVTIPVVETQTLVQHLFETVTITTWVQVTSVRPLPQLDIRTAAKAEHFN